MKALFINSVCGIRSTGRIVVSLVEKFEADGIECRVAYGRESVPAEYSKIAYRICSENEVKINALKARAFDNEGFNAKKETQRFLDWAERFDPDILWLHNLHGYYINVGMLFEWIKGRPNMRVRWTLHDCWAFTGHCAHFSFVGCEQWKNSCEKCPQKGEYPKSLFADNCKKNFLRKKEAFCGVKNMTLITPSAWLAGLAKKSFLKDYPVEVVHNTIDETVFKPTASEFRKEHGLENKTLILGVASAWGARKGLSDFLRLSELLDNAYTIVLVGLTKEQLRGLPKNVFGIERTNSKKELAQIYSAADVFVNPTYEDTFPTVNLEAAACGTPVITYDTGGCPETVSPESVVPQGDLKALMAKIKELKEKNEYPVFRHGVRHKELQ